VGHPLPHLHRPGTFRDASLWYSKCPNQLKPVGFSFFDTIREENMFGVLRLEHKKTFG